jgi:hypothetical protein
MLFSGYDCVRFFALLHRPFVAARRIYLLVVQLGGDISSNGGRLLPQLVTLGRNCLWDELDFSVFKKEAWQMLGVALRGKYTRMHQVCVAVVAVVASLELN